MTRPPFQALVDAHWRDVARLAHALAGPSDGDDVAQQAWVQALAAYPRADPRNIRSWLFTITRNCAMDVHRRTRRTTPHDDPTSLSGAHSVGPPSTCALPEGPDTKLWQRVSALPERQREAVVLKYVADLDHREIASILATTPAMSRRLVSDALATLRMTQEPR
ncbi:MAG TPA: sigma-70 family RNA polymerase sigma factor [Phycicoccus sp.]|nr:sigma-70 family RNA polymerase sigma factor [Phycicoccus sp.]